MSKGLELPINTMVVLGIALVVAVVAILFVTGALPTLTGQSTQGYISSCCSTFVLNGGCDETDPQKLADLEKIQCSVSKELDSSGKMTLKNLVAQGGITDVKQACGCEK